MNYNTIILIVTVAAAIIIFYISEKSKKQRNEEIDNSIKEKLNGQQTSKEMIKKAYIYETKRNPFNTTRKSGTTLEYKVFADLFRYKGKVLSDLYVDNGYGNSTQVDIVFVHNTGIYVIECKDWKAIEILGSEVDSNFRCIYNKGYTKSYSNPFKQNHHHIKYLVSALRDMCKESDFISVVVTECKNIKVNYKSNETNYYQDIVPYISLRGYLNKIINKRKSIFSDDEVLNIYKYLHEKYANVSSEVKKAHYEKVTKKSNKK